MQFMCIFHGLSDSLYTYSMTSYYILGAPWSQLPKWSLHYIFCFFSLKYDNVFSHSLFNLFVLLTLLHRVHISSLCLLNSACPPNIVSCICVGGGREVKINWEQCQQFTQHSPPTCLLLLSLLSYLIFH